VLIGLDFDNTIVCYDPVFATLARERSVPEDVADAGKTAIRDYLRAKGREGDWTVMQGEAYGARMKEAIEFVGVAQFVEAAAAAGHRLVIVSHRTEKPYLGPAFDLHTAARSWWGERGFASLVSDTFFETTAEGKAVRISSLRCDVFVDDLWEFLGRSDLPQGLRRIWLDHGGESDPRPGLEKVGSWKEVAAAVLT
jgi:hypothetical protein